MGIYDFKVKAQDRSGEIAARFVPTAAMKDVAAKVEEVL